MALIFVGSLALAAIFGGLSTYTVTKIANNSPTHETVHAIVNNQIEHSIIKDNAHEFQQSIIIAIIVAALVTVAIIIFLRCLIRKVQRDATQRQQQQVPGNIINQVPANIINQV